MISQRPPWALDGSFLAFRYLYQLVPEFDAFLEKPDPKGPSLPKEAKDLLGARLVGRWKSGMLSNVSLYFFKKKIRFHMVRV